MNTKTLSELEFNEIINESYILFDFIAPNSSYYDGLNS